MPASDTDAGPGAGEHLRVAHVMAPGRVGGAERVVLDLTAALAASGIETHLIPVLDEGVSRHAFFEEAEGRDAGVPVHPIRLPPRRYLREMRTVRRRVAELGADLVHTHGYRADVVAARAARQAELATVTTVHGFTGGGLRNRLYERLQRRSLRSCDAVVAVSRPLADELRADGVPAERLHVVPNARALPTDLLSRAEARRRLEVPDDAFHVGWIGRMSREKAPDVMVAALEALASREDALSFRATFIGDGPERADLGERTGRGDLQGRVRWPGELPDAARLLPGFDVLVLSSRTEGTPIVALEAMGTDTPLVATRVGGVPDLLGEGSALLEPPEDPEALAAAVKKVHDDPEGAARRAETARRRLDEVASPERWARRYADLYRAVLAGAGRGGREAQPC